MTDLPDENPSRTPDDEHSDGGPAVGTVHRSEADADGGLDSAGLSDGADPPPRSISKDVVFALLRNPRRRAVLRYLLAHPDRDRFQMRTVAEEVAAWEYDTTVPHLTYEQRQRVYISLYQTNLPKLDEHGVITYNQNRGTIERTPLLAVFEPFLEEGLRPDSQELSVDETDCDAVDTQGRLARFVPSIRTKF